MISAGRSRICSASAVGKVSWSSVNFEYVVDSIRKIRITSSTSMNGIKLISGSSSAWRRKFMALAASDCAAWRMAHQVRHHPLGRLLEVDGEVLDAAAEVAVEHQRRDRDDQSGRGVVQRDR